MSPTPDLHPRERQIMDAVYLRGEATVSEVRGSLPDAPSYSTVRAMMTRLEAKGYLTHTEDGVRYVYRPVRPREEAQESALGRVIRTFFDGSPTRAVAAILDRSAGELPPEELDELARLIDEARSRGRES